VEIGLLLVLAAVLTQCSGGGGGSDPGFDVIGFSATAQSPRLYLNDPIEIVFSDAVDPRTVFSGIHIYPSVSAGAKRAAGEFRVDGKRVIFTPRLPSDPTFTDGGFLPATEYTICVPLPDGSCSVYIQRSPGVRSLRGRGVPTTRTETFRTVVGGSAADLFRPEVAPRRPEVLEVAVKDAVGVEQRLNPIVNLVSGQRFEAGVLTTVAATPPSTIAPGSGVEVPAYRYAITPLTASVSATIDPDRDVLSRQPLTIRLTGPSRPIEPDEFTDRGGVLTLRDASDPPVEATWAVDSNTEQVVVTHAGSGPGFDEVGFERPPLTLELSQGITRQVAPGDAREATEVRITFDEPLNPLSVKAENFALYHVTDEPPQGLRYETIPLASTLMGAARRGITHEVVDGRSVVTLRPRTGFPRSRPGAPAIVVIGLRTAQTDNSAVPAAKFTGLRDLNDFALAYPRRTGWIDRLDARGRRVTVGYIHPLPYQNASSPPEQVRIAWGFQPRADGAGADTIVEDFIDRGDRSQQLASTAAWSKGQQAGLYATFGYGGDGELGDAWITGATTIDTDSLPPGPDGVVELNYGRFVVASSGTVTLRGRYPARINALDEVIVEGLIDASGGNGLNAPAGSAGTVGGIAGGRGGPGGGAGGEANTNPNGPVGALPAELRGGPGIPRAEVCGEPNRSENLFLSPAVPNCGGGTGGNRGRALGLLLRSGCSGNGGGHASDGFPTDYLCSNRLAFGDAYGVRWIVPDGGQRVTVLTAGSGGGAGGNAAVQTGDPSPAADVVGGSGGGAGGGVELRSAGRVLIGGTASILARGGNGGHGYQTVVGGTTVHGGYGGGGAGGSIWVSGTSVVVEDGATLDATGGAGNPSPTQPGRSGNGGEGYIIFRDRGSHPAVSANAVIAPAPLGQREDFDPASNGKSVAYSRWYDAGRDDPHWQFDANDPASGELRTGQDVVWLNPPRSGQRATIQFQGAPDLDGKPNPDPGTWVPAGNTPEQPGAAWEPNIARLASHGGLRHVRFKITFDIGKRDKGEPAPNQVAITRISLRHGDGD